MVVGSPKLAGRWMSRRDADAATWISPSVGSATQAAVEAAWADVGREDPEYELHALARANDFGCVLSVPMLREGQPVGAITVGREAGRSFSDEQIELLKTFASQAADRDRERKIVQRNEGGAGAADGNCRDPSRDVELAD